MGAAAEQLDGLLTPGPARCLAAAGWSVSSRAPSAAAWCALGLPRWPHCRRQWQVYRRALPGLNSSAVGLIVSSVFQLTLSAYGSSPFPITTICIGIIAYGATEVLAVPAPLVVSARPCRCRTPACPGGCTTLPAGRCNVDCAAGVPGSGSANSCSCSLPLQVLGGGALGVLGWGADMK